jgi:hypothetical protein
VQADTASLQFPEHVQRIDGGPEHAIQLRRDDHVTRPQCTEQFFALGPLIKRLAA